MGEFSRDDLTCVDAYCGSVVDHLHIQGCAVRIVADLGEWFREIKAHTPELVINYAFDPRRNRVVRSHFFGTIVTRDGELVGRSAVRLVVTEDFVDEVATMRLWGNRVRRNGRLDCIVLPEDVPPQRGRICHEGALWVERAHRRKGLGTTLLQLMRGVAIAAWQPNWINGIARDHIVDAGVSHNAYGMRAVPIVEGYSPVVDEHVKLYLTYTTPREVVASMKCRVRDRYAAE
ncbi:MAG: GNAT family N-acetyltransferase [Alphaproteobacteria bacterium]